MCDVTEKYAALNLLYPELDSKAFNSIDHLLKSEWEILQQKAVNAIQTYRLPVNERVLRCWYNITNGIIPSGLKVIDENGDEIKQLKAYLFMNDADDVRKRILNWSESDTHIIRKIIGICLRNNIERFSEEEIKTIESWRINL
jgi:hypothetical protein